MIHLPITKRNCLVKLKMIAYRNWFMIVGRSDWSDIASHASKWNHEASGEYTRYRGVVVVDDNWACQQGERGKNCFLPSYPYPEM